MRVRLGALIIFLLGLALATALVAYQGFAVVGSAIVRVEWGILAIVVWRFVPILANGLAWRAILGRDWRGPVAVLALLRWVRDSVNVLLPVAQVGGDVVGARLLALRGVPAGVAGASVLADKTMEVFAQFFFALAGLLVLAGSGYSGGVLSAAAIGLLVMLPLLAAFLAAQRLGLGKVLEVLAGKLARFLGHTGDGLAGLHERVLEIYRDPRRYVPSLLLHLLGWTAGAGEVWLILWFMGVPVGFAEAFILESLGQAVRSAAFVVPAAMGAQEAGYMALGAVVGLPPEMGLALSLVKRLRHLLVGVPALVVWQGIEGRRLMRAVPKRGDAENG